VPRAVDAVALDRLRRGPDPDPRHAKAVKILVRVQGWDEATAVKTLFRLLAGGHRAQQGGRALAFGHPSACDEIRDVLRRYPASAPLLTEARLPGGAP
jgi:hypothetical protein